MIGANRDVSRLAILVERIVPMLVIGRPLVTLGMTTDPEATGVARYAQRVVRIGREIELSLHRERKRQKHRTEDAILKNTVPVFHKQFKVTDLKYGCY